jgi:hypothetical protein
MVCWGSFLTPTYPAGIGRSPLAGDGEPTVTATVARKRPPTGLATGAGTLAYSPQRRGVRRGAGRMHALLSVLCVSALNQTLTVFCGKTVAPA